MFHFLKAILLIVLFTPLNITAQQNLNTVAVLDFQNTGGMGTSDVKSLTNRFRGLLVDTRSVIVVEREKMNEILKEQDFAMSDNCNTSECVVKVGELLGVQKMIAGSLGKVGQTYVIDIRLIDVSTGSILKSAHRDHKGEADGLLSVMEDIVTVLTESQVKAASGEQKISLPAKPLKPALSIYGEAVGIAGIYSVNADYRIIPHLSLRAGFTRWSFLGNENTGFPIGIHYLMGGRHSAELGAAAYFYSVKGSVLFYGKSSTDKGTIYAANISYRYQPEEGGFFFRASLYPSAGILNNDVYKYGFIVGVSIGFTTDSRKK